MLQNEFELKTLFFAYNYNFANKFVVFFFFLMRESEFDVPGAHDGIWRSDAVGKEVEARLAQQGARAVISVRTNVVAGKFQGM